MADFVISDNHFAHSNIILYCNRPFSSVEEMDSVMIDKWNSVVSPTDRVFHLGDFCFWKNMTSDSVRNLISTLNGEKHLILGNHDSRSKLEGLGFTTISNYHIINMTGFDTALLFHYPVYDEADLNRLQFEKKDSYLSRYRQLPKLRSWKYVIHGHIHNNSEVGYDNHFNASVECIDYTPIKVEEICMRLGN